MGITNIEIGVSTCHEEPVRVGVGGEGKAYFVSRLLFVFSFIMNVVKDVRANFS